MRKIKTKAAAEKKARKNQLIIGLVLIFLMVFSIAGFAFFSNDSEDSSVRNYENYDFIRSGNMWATQIENQVFYFSYLPQETEEIEVNGFYNLQEYSGKTLYFVNENPATQEILNNLGNYISRFQGACLNESCGKDLPVKNCTSNLIIFEEDGETGVRKEGGCIYISGNHILGSDAFMYRLFGIR